MAERKTKFTVGGCLGTVTGMAFAGIPFLAAGLVLYQIWKFFTAPNLLSRSLEVLGGVGLCIGAVFLLVVVIGKIPPEWLGYTEDDDLYF